MEKALEAAGVWPMKEYICSRQATITEYIESRPINELLTGEERMPGSIELL